MKQKLSFFISLPLAWTRNLVIYWTKCHSINKLMWRGKVQERGIDYKFYRMVLKSIKKCVQTILYSDDLPFRINKLPVSRGESVKLSEIFNMNHEYFDSINIFTKGLIKISGFFFVRSRSRSRSQYDIRCWCSFNACLSVYLPAHAH